MQPVHKVTKVLLDGLYHRVTAGESVKVKPAVLRINPVVSQRLKVKKKKEISQVQLINNILTG